MLERRKMLIVDDSEISRAILYEAFKEEYIIIEAYDGIQALKVLKEEKGSIDVVILDIMMPRMNGYGVLAEMRVDAALSGIPVIVVTAADDVNSEIMALDLGATDLITKPYDYRVIKRRVYNIVAIREADHVKAEALRLDCERRRLQQVFDNMLCGIVLFEIQEHAVPLMINNYYYKMTGYSKKEYAYMVEPIRQFICSEDVDALSKSLRKAVKTGHTEIEAFRIMRRDGTYLQVVGHSRQIPFEGTVFPVVLTMILDDRQNEKGQQRVQLQQQHYQILAGSIDGLTFDYNLRDDSLEYTVFDVEKNQLKDCHIDNYISNLEITKSIYSEDIVAYKEAMTDSEGHRTLEYRSRDENGRYIWVRGHLIGVPDCNGYITRVVGRIDNIQEEKEAESRLHAIIDLQNRRQKELEIKAEHDAVTGLLNRGTSEEYMRSLLKNGRWKNNALVVVDIDNFKRVNDTCGHLAGDEVLKHIGQIITEAFRATDIVGRLGGDEMIALLYRLSDERLISEKVCKILEEVSKLRQKLDLKTDISISMGIAISPRDGMNFETLYRKADSALYEAKQKGRNTFVFFRKH